MGRTIAKLLFICWLIAFVGAFVMFIITPAKDFGFTAGMNRIGIFFGWQIAAGMLSVLVFSFGRGFETKTLWRWLTRIPLIIASLLFFMVLFLIIGANLSKPNFSNDAPPSGQATAAPSLPAKPAQRVPTP